MTAVDAAHTDRWVEYELLDDDGSLLCGPITEPLTSDWWATFQPLERNYG